MAQRTPASQPTAQPRPSGGRPGGQRVAGNGTAAAQQRVAAKPRAEEEEQEELLYEGDGFAGWLGDQVSWITSMVVHVVMLLVFALWGLESGAKEKQHAIVVNDETVEEIVEDVEKPEFDESPFKDLAQG